MVARAREALPDDSDYYALIDEYVRADEAWWEENWCSTPRSRRNKFSKKKALGGILSLDPAEQVAVLRIVFAKMRKMFPYLALTVNEHHRHQQPDMDNASDLPHELPTDWLIPELGNHALANLATDLLEMELCLKPSDIEYIIDTILGTEPSWPDMWPLAAVVRAIKTNAKSDQLDQQARNKLLNLGYFAGTGVGTETRTLALEISDILRKVDGTMGFIVIPNEWGKQVQADLDRMDARTRERWNSFIAHATAIQRKSSPTERWLLKTGGVVEKFGADALVAGLDAWLAPFTPETIHREPNTDLIKALVWAATPVNDDRLPPLLSRLCEVCYRKIPGVGPANLKVGNACMYALGELSGERAAAELVRLRSRIKFNQGRNQIERALSAVAARTGLSVEDLEEIALPGFGLDAEGTRRKTLGGVTAEIRITGSDEVTLGWIGADGKPRKSAPASVKRDHAEDLKGLRAEIKEIKGLLSGQRFRMESLYLQQRTWPFAVWRERYLDHPLTANLTRRLIWSVGGTAVIPIGKDLIGADGEPVNAPEAKAEVSLWHPVNEDADTVLAWRRRLAALEVTQPFKQAHREIYVLTDAESATNVYSNRFAGHIVRQHLLNALCQARAWRFGQYLVYDMTGETPGRTLPAFGLQAAFYVDPIDYEQYTDATGAYLYLASDQVRFSDDANADVPLAQVPPIVFSEIMRDVDLFIGVASVGANPEWQDGGPDGRHRDYWWEFSFGDIGERGKTRYAALADILPKLKIAGRCELTGKFLTVRGTKRTYKIHLGSGNILMEPNDQYLCIVQGRSGKAKGGAGIRLPFEGDGVFSIILSKAFMLAEDDKITDPTILSQIGG